jgi:hypothetical protein
MLLAQLATYLIFAGRRESTRLNNPYPDSLELDVITKRYEKRYQTQFRTIPIPQRARLADL